MSKKNQLHKRLPNDRVAQILENYLAKELDLSYALEYLDVSRSRFYQLLSGYNSNPDNFCVVPTRLNEHRKINNNLEKAITAELKKEKDLINNRDMPIKYYNYSAVRDEIKDLYGLTVSVPTIITRAKNQNFYIVKPKRKIHDREVLTNFTGELVQHDSSHHLWSPFMNIKLYLITSLDDYSRALLFADVFERENTWNHILALKSTILEYGAPLKYYPDQHSIFRYVKDRDKIRPWHQYTVFTDEVDTQFKQVLSNCGTQLIYALSPQAKGKIERPYRWLQDRLVRACAKKKITTIDEVRSELKKLIYDYNYKWVHSTTKEIPMVRLEKAIKEGKTMFKPLEIKPPLIGINDIFCLRDERTVDGYQKISINKLEIKVPKSSPRDKVRLNIIPDYQTGIAEVRIWREDKLLSVQNVKINDLRL